MMSAPRGPQQLKDRIVQSRVHRERDQFIASIPEHQVLTLASSYRNAAPCDFFDKPKRGSYNICYFVQFPDGVKWVVRVPLAPCLAFGGRRKLESEVAAMQVITSRTTIPIPRLIAYAASDGPEPLSSFLILEFVKGQKLDLSKLKNLPERQQANLYTSLADIYIQLRRLEFPSIGCLDCGPDGIQVNKKTISLDINMQELEGLQPSSIQASYYDPDSRLTSANKYVAMLLDISDNAFARGRGSVLEEDVGGNTLYHLHLFRQYAQKWVNPLLDQGPFVMVHGDLEPFNLIVNEDMTIISVLDWEWSRVVPRQFFIPPLWLGVPDTTKLAYNFVYQDYLKRFHRLLDLVRTRELDMYGQPLLADEWTVAKNDSGFLVANALENWTDMDWFAHRYINWKWYRGQSKEGLDARVKAFMEDPAHRALITAKLDEGRAYKAALDGLKNGTDKAAAANRRGDFESLLAIIKRFVSLVPAFPNITWGGVVILAAGTSYFIGKHILQSHFPRWR
ncbi:phosphotransferase enzyme family protein [Lasiosphaeria ovina]|uniref:Phosphotransferase enzyme family protein n=1 Tax=Lasiosphaeria ovina TaxID=92902 RepID=A0AAE0JS37_9PEZI|nr:phosphotransferase enzyme family protein [Lasiosphaeria ovina]